MAHGCCPARAPADSDALVCGAQVFASIDVNKDGTLSQSEVVNACKKNPDLMLELTQHSQTNLRLFQRMDRDGDGKITLNEFLNMFLSFE